MIKETPIEKLAKDNVDLVTFFNDHIAGCKPGVGKLVRATVCPFHDDTDPSFHYWEKIHGFRCFGCGVTGDVIKLYQLYCEQYLGKKYTRVEAAKALLDMYKIEYGEIENAESANIFEQYRNEYIKRGTFRPKRGMMDINQFREQNREIMNIEDIDERIAYYNILDRRAALVIAGYVENSGTER